MEDARFEDGADRPLRLVAFDAEDLKVISALVQDAVLPMSEMKWEARNRRFALLVNRFRWEDLEQAERMHRPVERVQSVLAFNDVEKVKVQGLDPKEKDVVLSILSLSFEPTDEVSGRVIITLAGDGAIALEVEALDAILRDVTRPYVDPARRAPSHPL
ncbi:MAG: DUF2948 family protein [Alphaproteobacteria bacterium]|nr:MAG: DUF2948 family protein [Alphaproteobacteria bacterium]